MRVRNTFIIFLVSGFWHGANWTFIAWGALNALFIMPSIIFNTNRNNIEIVAKGRMFPTFRELFSVITTFFLAVFAWIFFRAMSIGEAFSYIKGIFTNQEGTIELKLRGDLIILVILFTIIEWIGREQQFALATFGLKWNKHLRRAMYLTLVCCFGLAEKTNSLFILIFKT